MVLGWANTRELQQNKAGGPGSRAKTRPVRNSVLSTPCCRAPPSHVQPGSQLPLTHTRTGTCSATICRCSGVLGSGVHCTSIGWAPVQPTLHSTYNPTRTQKNARGNANARVQRACLPGRMNVRLLGVGGDLLFPGNMPFFTGRLHFTPDCLIAHRLGKLRASS